MNKYQKGFTIVELIVVIAIIAVLAGIVLVNVTGYITKARDAAIKSDMSNIALGMGTCYAENNKYSNGTTFCDALTAYVPANLKTDILTQYASSAFTVHYNALVGASPSAYCAQVKLNDGTFLCIDSTGITKTIADGDCDATNATCAAD